MAQPLMSASATFFRALLRSFQSVLRDTPISKAASSWYMPSKSTRRNASSSSRVNTTVCCSLSGTPDGWKLAIGGIAEIQRWPRHLPRPLPLPWPFPFPCRGMIVYICELLFIGCAHMRGCIYSFLLMSCTNLKNHFHSKYNRTKQIYSYLILSCNL